MSTDLVLPALPFGGTEARVVRWLRQPGEPLAAGEPLLIAANERVEVLLPAPAAGTLAAILTPEGALALVGAPLAQLEAPRRLRTTPLARRIAQALGLALHTLHGSGPGGRIMRRDLPDADKRPLADDQRPLADDQRPLADDQRPATDNQRRTTSDGQPATDNQRSTTRDHNRTLPINNDTSIEAVAHARTSSPARLLASSPPHLFTSEVHALSAVEVDLDAVLAWCGRQTAGRGPVVTPLACVAQAAVAALLGFPLLNAAWHDKGIVVRRRVHLEVRPGSAQDGAAPLHIPDAQDLNLRGLARALGQPRAAAEPPPAATFTLAEGQGWTTAALPAPGQSALLSLGAITRRPRVVGPNGAERVGLRSVALLSLAYDARVLDQPTADAFLAALRRRLEQFAG